MIYGSKDDGSLLPSSSKSFTDAYDKSPMLDGFRKYKICINGADHLLGGIPGNNITKVLNCQVNVLAVHYTMMAMIAFFDANLKKSNEAFRYLDSDKLCQCSGGVVQLTTNFGTTEN